VPCSHILRSVVANLVELFGSTREVQLRSAIEAVSLPAYRRRALVLAASELVINALRHAFKGRREGQIVVVLRILSDRHARFIVADDGIGCHLDPVEAERGVAGGLASLLESDLVYAPYSAAGTVSEITFPTRF
jgi:two-component sensor histidine kinase